MNVHVNDYLAIDARAARAMRVCVRPNVHVFTSRTSFVFTFFLKVTEI